MQGLLNKAFVAISFAAETRRKKAIQSLRPAGFTPAFGRAVRAFGPAFTAWLKPGPSGPCHSTVFAPFGFAQDGEACRLFAQTIVLVQTSCRSLHYGGKKRRLRSRWHGMGGSKRATPMFVARLASLPQRL